MLQELFGSSPFLMVTYEVILLSPGRLSWDLPASSTQVLSIVWFMQASVPNSPVRLLDKKIRRSQLSSWLSVARDMLTFHTGSQSSCFMAICLCLTNNSCGWWHSREYLRKSRLSPFFEESLVYPQIPREFWSNCSSVYKKTHSNTVSKVPRGCRCVINFKGRFLGKIMQS